MADAQAPPAPVASAGPVTDKAATASTASTTQTPAVDDLPLLSLSLTREAGKLHFGSGSGSNSEQLSAVAHSQHAFIAPIVLSYSSSFKAAQAAMNPSNLPRAPTELPQLIVVGEEGSAFSSTANSSAAPSTAGTPTASRSPSPPLSGVSSTAATPTASSFAANTPVAPVPQRPSPVERKSVFGKLFERNNASTSSVSSVASTTVGPVSTASSTTGAAEATIVPAAAAAGAVLTRKVSKKDKDKEDKAGRPRAESNGYLSTSSANEKWGMGAALNEFMRNKVARKSSATSKKSDDGKSDRGGSAYNKEGKESKDKDDGGSAYGGSNASGKTGNGEETKSKSGQTTASTLKKYGVCEKVLIGKGATAVVKLAHKWDRTTERLYAVKEFRKRRKNETEKEYVKKLTSEFCISSTLHHQNIVETVDLVQDEQSHWCEVMEYCPGGDLYAAIKKGTLSPPVINSYFKQILHGVAYLHSMGVAHRDIKPENLLLDAKGHVKITDFGVSDVFRMCWEKTTHLSKGLCGSEPYIAPEQFDQKEYDARLVDVWAIAVVYYCMNFQELPWRLAKPSDPSFGPYLQSYSSTLSPAPLGNLVPRECRAVIKKMLEPDPKKRVGVMEILAEDWVRKIEVLPKEDGVGGAPPEVQTAGLPSSSYPVAAPVAPVALPAALPAPVIAPTTPTLPET